MRVYEIGKDCQASEIGTGEAARKFLAWLADDANPALTRTIHSWWLAELTGTSGPGTLASPASEAALPGAGTTIDNGKAARRFLAWLADEANPALTRAIHSWMWEPAEAGGLGALAESADELSALRAEIIAACQTATTGQPAEASHPAEPGPAAGEGAAR